MLEKRKVRTFLSKVGHIEEVHYLHRGRGIFHYPNRRGGGIAEIFQKHLL